jgi:hypothetical protein
VNEQRTRQIRSIIAKNYSKMAIAVAQGADLYSVAADAVYSDPAITAAVIQRMFETNQMDTLPFKLRVLTEELIFTDVHNPVHVDKLMAKTGFTEEFVISFALSAAEKFPLLFSSQIVKSNMESA